MKKSSSSKKKGTKNALDAEAPAFVPRDLEEPAVPPPEKKKSKKKKKKAMECRFYQQGNCKKGNACQFLHSGDPAAVDNGGPPPPPAAAPAKKKKEKPVELQFACPFCGDAFSVSQLGLHLQEHQGEDVSQVCPICAAAPGGDPTYHSQDIFSHFTLRHGAPKNGGLPMRKIPVSDRQAVKVCSAIDRGAFQSRGLDFVWEYCWRIDSTGNNQWLQTPCVSCGGRMGVSEVRALLGCGCVFHAGCLENRNHVVCPHCNAKFESEEGLKEAPVK